MPDRARERAEAIVEAHEDNRVQAMQQGGLENRICSLCGGPEYATRQATAEYTVEEYETVCRWGYEIQATVLAVRIPDFFDELVEVNLFDAHCENHGADVEFSAREIRREATPVAERATGEVEFEGFFRENYVDEHHVSYAPEETVEVCRSCHSRIHDDEAFRPDLTPEMTRGEWEERTNA